MTVLTEQALAGLQIPQEHAISPERSFLAQNLVLKLNTARNFEEAQGIPYVATYLINGGDNEQAKRTYLLAEAPLSQYMNDGDKPDSIDRVEAVYLQTGDNSLLQALYCFPATTPDTPSHVILDEAGSSTPEGKPRQFISLATGVVREAMVGIGSKGGLVRDLPNDEIFNLSDARVIDQNSGHYETRMREDARSMMLSDAIRQKRNAARKAKAAGFVKGVFGGSRR